MTARRWLPSWSLLICGPRMDGWRESARDISARGIITLNHQYFSLLHVTAQMKIRTGLTILPMREHFPPSILTSLTFFLYCFTQRSFFSILPSMFLHHLAWKRTPEGRPCATRGSSYREVVVIIDHLLLDYMLPLASLLYGSISFIFASDLPYEHIYLKLGTSKPEGCDMTPSL